MKKIALFFNLLLLSVLTVFSQPLTSVAIDKLVERTMKTFQVPGIAVAIVEDGKVVHSKGYGVSSLKTGEKVDENTLFGIASNSKAFCTATLGILVDEKKIGWNDKVINYIPEFRLYNPYVTEDFTIKDLITHRSGLGMGAGDLMVWPDSSDFTINDIIHNLRYLKQTTPFRTKYDYDNLLYMVAGEVVARISGMSWEQFVEERIMSPLGMDRSAASFARLKNKTNAIEGHTIIDNVLQVVPRHDVKTGQCSAAGIYSSISDMSKWMICQLDFGKYGQSPVKQLFSSTVQKEMWSPHTNQPVRSDKYNSHFNAYGLGWNLTDVKGTKQVSHTGGMEGMVTQVILLPEMKLGIVVLTNQESGAAFSSISNTIKDSYLGFKPEDWVLHYDTIVSKSDKEDAAFQQKVDDEINAVIKANKVTVNPADFSGTYKDDWLGEVKISEINGKLWFQSIRSPQLRGEMKLYKGNTFAVRWVMRSMKADAFVIFNLGTEGKATGFKMKPISPATDFSYDFQDLNFVRK